ncbi:hypothetical protein SteCoe_14524 [Stentor coeruleus]|uniref:Protein kinase domain-containing protein n=1 Tax=Stentor coeruleus TaxID=5963 RepID=A0A1R2C5R7_9CILI|nr:hypothetical protein SteCoe_14524 [Stentor coeruleus]
MEHDIALEKNLNILDVSSDLSNKSFLISPQNQKVLFQLTYEIEGIYQHIMRKDRRDKLKNLLRYDSNLKQGRYTVKKPIGRGSFGSVVQAVDNILGIQVAIKIVKPKYGWTIQTNNELANLKKVNQMETDNLYFVKMLDYFEENGYLCIVLELLEKTLYHFLLETKGMSLQDVEAIALQLFKALKALHNLNIVHCDLKPENIMIQGQGKKDIKIVDFGSSCIAGNSVYKFVQSRYYRSPEVALRIEYGMPIDVWSAGCIIAELYIGRPLFESRSETLQMSKTVSILGPLPRSMLEKSQYFNKYFNLTRFELSRANPLKNYILQTKPYLPESVGNLDKFIDLLGKCLTYDPASRITADEALNHPFITVNSHKSLDKSLSMPWPTKMFLSFKSIPKSKPYMKIIRSNSIFHDGSQNFKLSTAVSRNSRVTCTDEDLAHAERPGSYVHSKPDIIPQKSNSTPKY